MRAGPARDVVVEWFLPGAAMARALWEGKVSPVEALEARLRADPDDWPSWLVYADFLTDQGDIRGRLIVLEHRLAVGALSEDERYRLRAELVALVDAHREEWLEGWRCPDQSTLEWRHGFVRRLQVRPASEAVDILEELVARPAGRLLAVVSFDEGKLGPGGVARLARSGALQTLVGLGFYQNELGPEGAVALARSEHLRGLAQLSLSWNQLGTEGASALAVSENLRSLTMLRLSRERIGLGGALALARSRMLRALTELDLSDNGLGYEAIDALAASPALRSLVVLVLSGNRVDKASRERLARALPRCAIEW